MRNQNPDIVCLQEANKFTQKSLEALAASYGHPYAVLQKEKVSHCHNVQIPYCKHYEGGG
ncbi:hypothetical protein SFC43_25780 [Bacteroides sp. CR5/BHMF/2]|nr:hypothetical protein [Bacteroides sp. CR5/BHMF/2]